MSEYSGRIHALKELEKLRGQFVFDKVNSAMYDVGSFLEANEDSSVKSKELLIQAKEQLETLIGFLREFK